MTTKLVLVAGFLGAGKTTLLREAGRRLTARGHAVGLVTNDQAPDLVDTALLTGVGMGVEEVAGSCFCCNFGGFEQAVQSLVGRRADIVLAEPVGSCTDLAATIVRPLEDRRPDLDIAPFTVLASPNHVRVALQQSPSALHENAVYILGLQLAEADHLLLNKVDRLPLPERAALSDLLRTAHPDKTVGEISALTGEGIDEWLDRVLAGGAAGQHIVDVDYDRYAEGEAVLGWLNAGIRLESNAGEADFLAPMLNLMGALHREFRASRSEIGHLKATVVADGERRSANLTRLEDEVLSLDATPLQGTSAELILNARVQMHATALEAVAQRAIAGLSGPTVTATATTFRCLTPGRPQPTYRYERESLQR